MGSSAECPCGSVWLGSAAGLASCSSVAYVHVHAHTCTESVLLLRFISHRQKPNDTE